MSTPVSTSPKPWPERRFTICSLPGGTESQVFMLRDLLSKLPCTDGSTITWKTAAGNEVSAGSEDRCIHELAALGLVVRNTQDQWTPSRIAREWLIDDNPILLASHLHANVKFFGELLNAIGPETTQKDLLKIAKNMYGLNWTSLDPVRRRTAWLRSLGMVELWGQKVVRTSSGDLLLDQLELCSANEARGLHVSEAGPSILDNSVLDYLSGLAEFGQEALRQRRPLIGYIPRGVKSTNRDTEASALTPTAAARKLIEIVGTGMTVEEFRGLCNGELGISRSSFDSTLHALRHMGLLEQTSLNSFEPTANARWLTSVGNEKVLVAFLHTRYVFFGEVLRHLDEPATPSQLVKIARENYGYAQATNGEIRLRLAFLQDAGLTDRIDWQRFRANSVGKSFASELPLQDEVTENQPDKAPIEEKQDTSELLPKIVDSLQKLSRDGNESKAFEGAVSEAFNYLGFRAEHLGGPGRTDVLVVAELAPEDRYRVIVDAKSSGSGLVGESSVNFDVLRDHKKKHKADYVVVVGPDFANRLKDWAVDNSVILLHADDLAVMLEQHSVNPISLVDFRDTFARVDTHRDEVFERYQALDRRSSLMASILGIIFQEAVDEDPIAAGFMSLENITYAVRKEFTPRPSAEEISESLGFLSNPVVAALEESKGRYKLADSPHNISLRLRGLGSSLSQSERASQRSSPVIEA